MRHLTLAAAAVATLAFATAAYADSNYGPRQNGNQCWHHQNGDALGYWSPCPPPRNGQAATRTTAPATANNAGSRKR